MRFAKARGRERRFSEDDNKLHSGVSLTLRSSAWLAHNFPWSGCPPDTGRMTRHAAAQKGRERAK